MKLTIDQDNGRLTVEDGGTAREMDLYSDEAFELIAHQYVRVGWNQKQVYTYSWMGRPVIQLPDDMVRTQEVIYRLNVLMDGNNSDLIELSDDLHVGIRVAEHQPSVTRPLAEAREEDPDQLAQTVWENTCRLYNLEA